MTYCPFVEYYRRQTAPRTAPGEAIALPGVGGGWRKTRGPFGMDYIQDGTGFVLPANVIDPWLKTKLEIFASMRSDLIEALS